LARNHTDYRLSALAYSLLAHVVLVFAVVMGLPHLWESHREALPTAVSVEIVPIGQTNIKPKDLKKKDKTKEAKPATAKKSRSASKSNKAAKKTKPKAIPTPKKKVAKKPKQQEKPKEKPKKPAKSDLSSILRSVADAAKRQQGDQNVPSNQDQKRAISDNYNPSLPMAMSEIDAIRSQFVQCWNIPAGAKNAHDLKIVVDIRLQSNGRVTQVELAKEKSRYYSDSFFRAAADSAMRAVRRCSPLKNLPTAKYETWRYIQLTFNPHDLLY